MCNRKHNVFKRCVFGCIVGGALLIAAVFVVVKPRIFTFHSDVKSNHGISGQVFRSSDGMFIIKLNSGSQLTVQQNPAKAFLLTKHGLVNEFRVGRFLVVPASEIGGLDLSQSESFDRQVPIFSDNKVTLKDPMSKNGVFDFPLN